MGAPQKQSGGTFQKKSKSGWGGALEKVPALKYTPVACRSNVTVCPDKITEIFISLVIFTYNSIHST